MITENFNLSFIRERYPNAILESMYVDCRSHYPMWTLWNTHDRTTFRIMLGLGASEDEAILDARRTLQKIC